MAEAGILGCMNWGCGPFPALVHRASDWSKRSVSCLPVSLACSNLWALLGVLVVCKELN